MGTFRFSLKFQRVGNPGDAADSPWNLIGQIGRENDIFYRDILNSCSHNYTLSGVKRDRRKLKWSV